jgi:hypothetical protein
VARFESWILELRGAAERAGRVLPGLLGGDFAFALALWVAVFVTAAAVVSSASVPLRLRYAVGLCAVTYLAVYAEINRLRRPLRWAPVILAAADGAVAVTIYVVSMPWVPYGHLLLFFAGARMVGRFGDLRAVPAGLLVLTPFLYFQRGQLIGLVLMAFAIVMLLLGLQILFERSAAARHDAAEQACLRTLVSALARADDADAVGLHLMLAASRLLPGTALAVWLRDEGTGEFLAARWAGLPAGERPAATVLPPFAAASDEAIEVAGPLPGTTAGELTVFQPITGGGQISGLISISGTHRVCDARAVRGRLQLLAEEAGVALERLRGSGEQRTGAQIMETANRLAGAAAPHGHDEAAALAALLVALQQAIACDSLHLEWCSGSDLKLVISARDPLFFYAPASLTLAGTRAADALETGQVIRESVTGRRPEDVLWAATGMRAVATAPLWCANRRGTLHLARRQPRPFSLSEAMLTRLLAERLALIFDASLPQGDAARRRMAEASA